MGQSSRRARLLICPFIHILKLRTEGIFATELVASLMTSEMDIVVVTHPPSSEQLTLVQLQKKPLFMAMPMEHPVAENDVVRLEGFRDLVFQKSYI